MLPRNSAAGFTGFTGTSSKMRRVAGRVNRWVRCRVMRRLRCGGGAGAVSRLASAPARAEGEGPVIVIPSRPGVPVVINGRDASYAVVEGDWGLSRPGAGVGHGDRRLADPAEPGLHPAQLVSSEIWPRARARPQRDRAAGRSRAARSGRELLALVVDVVRRHAGERYAAAHPAAAIERRFEPAADYAPATITDPQTYPQNFNPPSSIDPRTHGVITTERITRAATAG